MPSPSVTSLLHSAQKCNYLRKYFPQMNVPIAFRRVVIYSILEKCPTGLSKEGEL